MRGIWKAPKFQTLKWNGFLSVFTALAGVAVLAGQPQPARAATPAITLITHDPAAQLRPEDSCVSAGCQVLVRLIDGAQSTIDFAIYGARRQSDILSAVVRARQRGVRVRGVVNRDWSNNNYYADTPLWEAQLGDIRSDYASEQRLNAADKPFYPRPKCKPPAAFKGPVQCIAYDAGANWIVAAHASLDNFASDNESDGSGDRIMHHKFFVVDGRRVFTGSANISDSDIGGYSANVMLVIDSAAVAAAYGAEFEQLWAGRFHSEKKRSANTSFNVEGIPVRVLFSPQDKAVEAGVRPLLAQARSSIDLAIFYLTNKYITADLLAAQQRGVQVRVIVDATSAENGYSKHEILRAAGIQVKVEAWGGKMHAKAAAIDRKWLIAGSMNWTRAGDDTNDENTLLINSPRLAAQQHAYFEGLWRGIPERWLTDRPAPESRESGTACSDGIDNDFDGLIDSVAGNADPGCSGRAALVPLPGHRVISKAQSPAPPKGYTLVRAFQK